MKDVALKARDSSALSGNGAPLVRELAVAKAIQERLGRLYQLDDGPMVTDFASVGEDEERETLFVREPEPGALEMHLRVPRLGKKAFSLDDGHSLDRMCQLIEGVSHFIYVADRANKDRATTQLELELQAEVDKYVVLVGALPSLDERSSRTLRERLFEDPKYLHDAGSEEGERYRLAHGLAAKFTKRLEVHIVGRTFDAMRGELRRFFRMGQGDKLRAVHT